MWYNVRNMRFCDRYRLTCSFKTTAGNFMCDRQHKEVKIFTPNMNWKNCGNSETDRKAVLNDWDLVLFAFVFPSAVGHTCEASRSACNLYLFETAKLSSAVVPKQSAELTKQPIRLFLSTEDASTLARLADACGRSKNKTNKGVRKSSECTRGVTVSLYRRCSSQEGRLSRTGREGQRHTMSKRRHLALH